MKYIFLVFMFFSSLFSNQTTIENKLNLTSLEKEFLKNNPVIKVGHTPSFEPLMFVNENGDIAGIYHDVYEKLAEKLNVKFDYVLDTWENTQKNLKDKKIDIIPVISNYLAQKNEFLIIKPSLGKINYEVFINKENDFIVNSLNDLYNKKVAYNKNIKAFSKYIEQYKKKINLVPMNNPMEMLFALNNKKVDAVIDFTYSKYNLVKYGLIDIKTIYTIEDFHGDEVTAIRDDNLILKSIINKAIDSLSLKDKSKIFEKWLGISDKLLLSYKEKSFLDSKIEFNVCTRYNHYPLSKEKNGVIMGISGDVFERISSMLNVKFKAIDSASDIELVKNIQENRCDLITTITKGYEGFKSIKTTNESIGHQHFVAIASIKSPYIENLEEKRDYTFYVNKTIHKNIFEKLYPSLNIVFLRNEETIMDRLSKDKKSVYINLSTLSDYVIQKYGVSNYKIINHFKDIEDEDAIGVNITTVPMMLGILDKTLKKIGHHELDDIYDEYKLRTFQIQNSYEWLWYVVGTLVIFLLAMQYRNIHNLKQKQESEKKLLKRYDAIEKITGSYSFTFTPHDMKFHDAKSLFEIFELDKSKPLTMELINECFDHNTRELIQHVIKAGEQLDYTYKITTPKGNVKYLKELVIPVKDNGFLEYIVSGTDITEDVLLKEELEDHKYYLEEKVKEQTQELVAKNDILQYKNEELAASEEELISQQDELLETQRKIEKLASAKEQFLANMSHEIRTPLNGISGIVNMLLDETQVSDSVIDKLNTLKKSSTMLTNIVNDILDISSLETGNMKLYPKEFSLRDMMNYLYNTLKSEFEDRKISFTLKIDDNVEDVLIADEIRLSQILLNLLNNAKKFTKEGKVELYVKTLSKQNSETKLLFGVNDTGIGMNEEIQNNLFIPFTQGNQSNTKEYKGTGLGLSIVKKLVDIMNGCINVTSFVGVGTKFEIELLLPYSLNKVISSRNHEILVLQKTKKALLVEDDKINQLVLKAALQKRNLNVDVVENGLEALEKLRTSNIYDIVFMDIQMPIMDGHEATKKIREFNQEIPIIALSAGVLNENKKQSIKAGMNMHIIKPLVLEELNEVLEVFFNAKENFENKPKEEKNKPNIEIKNPKEDFIKAIETLNADYGEDTTLQLLETFLVYEEIVKKENLSYEDIKKHIHKIKGSSGNLGFKNIYNICIDIESKEKDELLIKFDLIKRIVLKYIELCKEYLEKQK